MFKGRALATSRLSAAILFILLAALGTAQQPLVQLRVLGDGLDEASPTPLLRVLLTLEAAYQRQHPKTEFMHRGGGDDSALGCLYIGASDIAIMKREPSYIELDGYQQAIKGATPLNRPWMRGGVNAPPSSSPLVVIANRRSGIKQLSVAQLNAIFNAEPYSEAASRRRSEDLPVPFRQGSPTQLFGFPIESAAGLDFQDIVMFGKGRWVSGYHELHTPKDVVAEVQRHRNALGLVTLDAITTGVTVLAISGSNGVAYASTMHALALGEYPLGRTIRVLVRSGEGSSIDDQARSFAAFITGPEGQSIVADDRAYLPITPLPGRISKELPR